jgi:hypothetical protein
MTLCIMITNVKVAEHLTFHEHKKVFVFWKYN